MKRIKLARFKINMLTRVNESHEIVVKCRWDKTKGRSFQNFHRGIRRITRPNIFLASKQFPPPPPRLFYSKVRTRSLCYRGGKGGECSMSRVNAFPLTASWKRTIKRRVSVRGNGDREHGFSSL